jgi:integrase
MHFAYIEMTTHGFRRSAIVYYKDAGTPVAVIMSLSGHTSLDITVITAFLTCQRSVKLNEGRR